MIYRVTNATRNSDLGASIAAAHSSGSRRTGLLKTKALAPGAGLWISPCEAIHTWFMGFAIDVVFVDKKNRVRKISRALPPWRMSACFAAHSVLELPAGTLEATGTCVGDELRFAAQPAAA